VVEYGQHQKDAIAFQQVQPYSICAMATGTGKSVTTIGSELVNLKNNKLDKCIFVCTKGSIGEVVNDYNKFYSYTPEQINSTEKLKDFFEGNSKVAVTRYEWLKHFNPELMQQMTSQKRLGMWWDEAQRLKNGSRDRKQIEGTQTHKMGKFLRQFCSAYHLVTATPIMTTLDDLWSLMHLVDPSVLKSYQQFSEEFYVRELAPHPRESRRRKTCPTCGCRLEYVDGWDCCQNPYCQSIQTPYGFVPFKKKVRSIWELIEYQNLDVLSKLLQQNMFCFFPDQDINYIEHRFNLSSEVENLYYSIARDLIAKEDAGIPTPFATRMIELQYLVDRSNEKKLQLHTLATKLKQKGFVLYISLYDTEGTNSSTTTLEEVQKVLDEIPELSYRTYSGREVDEERDENKKWFQEDPANKCLIITEAGGASLNLQVTNEFVFYNLPAGFGKMSQALGRVVRLFSSFKSFNIHFLLAEHTVDVYKMVCFLMYEEIIRELMNNKLIKTSKPINFNTQMKAEMRKDLLWRN
jgi:hypothetical protein